MRLKRVAIGVACLVLLAGCAPTARQEMLDSLKVLDSRAVTFLSEIVENEAWPASLDEVQPEPTKRIYVWGGQLSPDDEVATGTAKVVVYGIRTDTSRIAFDVRLLGYGYTGGGWLAQSEDGYLCVEYAREKSVGDVERTEVECPEIIAPDMYGVRLVALNDVLSI